MFLKKVLLFYFLLPITFLHAQVNIDSIAALIQTSDGPNKVDLLNTLSWELKYSDPDRALQLNKESVKLSQEINYVKGEGFAQFYLAGLLYLKGDYERSLQISEKSFALFKKENNSFGLTRNWNLKGAIYTSNGKYEESLDNYNKALKACEVIEDHEFAIKIRGNIADILFFKGDHINALKEFNIVADMLLEMGDSIGYYNMLGQAGKIHYRLGNYQEALSIFFEFEAFQKAKNRKTHLANIYNSMGMLFLKLDLDDQSLEMFHKSLQLYETLGSQKMVGTLNLHIGNHYLKNKKSPEAYSFYQKALQIYDTIGVKSTGAIYNNLGELKIQSKEYEEAITILEKALGINTELDIKNNIAISYTMLGTAHLKLEQLQKSEQYFLQAMEIWEEIENLFEKQIAADALAKMYQQSGQSEKFEHYSKVAQSADDSIFSKEKVVNINKMLVTQLLTEHQEKIEGLNKELTTTKEQLTQSSLSMFRLILLLLFLCLIIGSIWLYKKRKPQPTLTSPEKIEIEENRNLKISLEQKNKQLVVLSLEAAQKNEFLEKLNATLKNVIRKNPELKKLEKVLNSNHLGQHNWNNFISYFNELHNGFFDRISNKFPTVTNKELRLCALIRLKIPIYEASIILGISPESVHKARYRVRKKMDIKTDISLDEFVCNI